MAGNIRLSKVAKEFNLNIVTIVEFLDKYGHNVSPNPNAKLTEEQYSLLEKHLHQVEREGRTATKKENISIKAKASHEIDKGKKPQKNTKKPSPEDKGNILLTLSQSKAKEADPVQIIKKLQGLSEMTDEQVANSAGIAPWMLENVMSGKLKNEVTVGCIMAGIVKYIQKKKKYTQNQLSQITVNPPTVIQDILSGNSQDWSAYLKCVEKIISYKPVVKVSKIEKKQAVQQDYKQQEKNTRSTRKKKRHSIDWVACEKERVIVKQKTRSKKKKAWEASRKHAQAIMAGIVPLPEPPAIRPEPSFLKEAYKKYEESKLALQQNNTTTSDPNEKHKLGKIIWELMDYLIHLKGYNGLLTKELLEIGYDTDAIMSLKEGRNKNIDAYQDVATYCLQLIGEVKGVNKTRWPQNTLSYSDYHHIINNPTKERFSADTFKKIFGILKTINLKESSLNKKIVSAYIRHQTYSSNNDFDYGITDT